MPLQGVLKGGGGDEAVAAVATNNWVAERLLAEGGDPAPKKLCTDLLRKLESFFDKVTSLLGPLPFDRWNGGGVSRINRGSRTYVTVAPHGAQRWDSGLGAHQGGAGATQGQGLQVKESLDRRLSAAQKEALYGNYALLLLLAGRADAAQDVTASLLAKCAKTPQTLITAAAPAWHCLACCR